MRQCTNCKCQVGSGIAVCPYCGTQLSLVDTTAAAEGTYIRYTGQEPVNGGACAPAYASGDAARGQRLAVELPVQHGTAVYYSCSEREKNSGSMETILLVLLICMIVANVFEFIALMLLLR